VKKKTWPKDRVKRPGAAWKRLFLVLTALFLSLAGAEAWLRAVHPMGALLLTSDRYQVAENPKIGYELKPLATDANSDGLRNRERTVDKPPSVFRILALGDSVTYGLGVERDKAWAGKLESLLNLDGPAGVTYEVLNLGVPGYGIGQIVERFKKKGLKYHPDLVIYGYWLNDIGPGFDAIELGLLETRKNRDIFSSRPWARWLARQATRLQITRRVLLLARRFGAARKDSRLENAGTPRLLDLMGPEILGAWRVFSGEYARTGFHATRSLDPLFRHYAELPTFVPWNARMRELAGQCQDLGLPCVLLLTPVFLDAAPGGYPLQALNDFILQVAEINGMQSLDETGPLLEAGSRAVRPGDRIHPSEAGHAIIARDLARDLRNSGLLEPPATPSTPGG